MTALLDPEIRAALVEHLRATAPEATVVHEVGMRWHSVRADVVAVSDVLHGFEIKSDADSLARLRWQVRGYSALFDRCTIVVGARHFAATNVVVPASWGVLVAEQSAADVTLREERAPLPAETLDPKALVRQLWRDDVVAMLRSRGIATRPRALVGELWELAEKLPIDVLREHARAAVVAHGDAREDLKERRAEARANRERHEQALERFVEKFGEKGATTG